MCSSDLKDIEIEFDSELLPDDNYRLSVIPYNKQCRADKGQNEHWLANRPNLSTDYADFTVPRDYIDYWKPC